MWWTLHRTSKIIYHLQAIMLLNLMTLTIQFFIREAVGTRYLLLENTQYDTYYDLAKMQELWDVDNQDDIKV